MSKAIEIFRSDSPLEAQMKAHLLEQCGLHPTLMGENLASTIGMGGHAAPCRVFVPEYQAKEALEIIQKFTDEQASSTVEPSNCPSCNAEWEPGFTVCWKCQDSL